MIPRNINMYIQFFNEQKDWCTDSCTNQIKLFQKNLIKRILRSKKYMNLVLGKKKKKKNKYQFKEFTLISDIKQFQEARKGGIIRNEFIKSRLGNFYNVKDFLNNANFYLPCRKEINNSIETTIKNIDLGIQFGLDGNITIAAKQVKSMDNIDHFNNIYELFETLENELVTKPNSKATNLLLLFPVLMLRHYFCSPERYLDQFKIIVKETLSSINSRTLKYNLKEIFKTTYSGLETNEQIDFNGYNILFNEEFTEQSVKDIAWDRHIVIIEQFDHNFKPFYKDVSNRIQTLNSRFLDQFDNEEYSPFKTSVPFPKQSINDTHFDDNSYYHGRLFILPGNGFTFIAENKPPKYITTAIVYAISSLISLSKSFQLAQQELDDLSEKLPDLSEKISDRNRITKDDESKMQQMINGITNIYRILPSLHMGVLHEMIIRDMEFRRFYQRYLEDFGIIKLDSQLDSTKAEIYTTVQHLRDMEEQQNNNIATKFIAIAALLITFPSFVADTFTGFEGIFGRFQDKSIVQSMPWLNGLWFSIYIAGIIIILLLGLKKRKKNRKKLK